MTAHWGRTGYIRFFTVLVLWLVSFAVRTYRIDARMWFEGDHSRELLFAANIVRDRLPLVISMETSGANFPNLPYYINALALVSAVSHGDPVLVETVFAAWTALVPPLLYIWGVIEGWPVAGLLGAVSYMLLPGAVEMSNIWGNLAAFVPAVGGIVALRYATRTRSGMMRAAAWLLVCTAVSFHYSHMGLMAGLLLAEGIRTHNRRRFLTDAGICTVTLAALAAPVIVALYRTGALQAPAITYADTCWYCTARVPQILTWLSNDFFHYQWIIPGMRFIIPGAVLLLGWSGIFVWRRIPPWILFVPVVLLAVMWLGAGQVAYWYAYPLIPFILMAAGIAADEGMRHDRPAVRIPARIGTALFLGAAAVSYVLYITTHFNYYRQAVRAADTVRATMGKLGISPSEYLEYARFYPYFPYRYTDTTAFWLVRQWKYGDTLTYNDPQRFYDPRPYRSSPPYIVLVRKGCADRIHRPVEISPKRYVRNRSVCDTGTDLQMEILMRRDAGKTPRP